MASGGRSGGNFTDSTKRILMQRAGGKCCRCGVTTIGPSSDDSKATNIGEAAHIAAAAEDGPRYDKNMTDDERKSASNGLWLCRNCHGIVDSNPREYTIEKLKQIKKNGEDRANLELAAPMAAQTEVQSISSTPRNEQQDHPTLLPQEPVLILGSSPARLGEAGITSPTSPLSPMKLVILELGKTDRVAVKWKMMGRGLGLEESEIEKIEADEKGIEEKCYQMLTRWAQSCSKPTPQQLMAALLNEGLQHAADLVKSITKSSEEW